MNTDSHHSANMNKSDFDAFALRMITDETGLERSLRDFFDSCVSAVIRVIDSYVVKSARVFDDVDSRYLAK